jgi:hypothetical protein
MTMPPFALARDDREIDALQRRFGVGGEHPLLPRRDWRAERVSDAMTLPYWAWVHKELFLAGGEAALAAQCATEASAPATGATEEPNGPH